MRAGWKKVRIGDVCRTGAGGTPLKARREYYDGGAIPWLLSGEVAQRDITAAKSFITKTGLENSSAKIFPANTVLVAMYGATAGQAGILRFESATNQAVCGIYPNENIVSEFLYYTLLHQKDELVATATGNAQPNISQIKIKDTEILLPSVVEQKRIVALLDEAFTGLDAAIANTTKNLANARELFNSYLNSVFSGQNGEWHEVAISDVCESIIDCVNKTAPQVEKPTPYMMIRTTNVRNGSIDLSSVKYVSEETYKIWTRRQVPKLGDVILTREAPMGEVGMLETMDLVFLGQRLVSYRADRAKLDCRFLLYAFRSNHVQGQIHALASGSTVQHMRVPDSQKLKIFLPKLDVQKKVVGKLDFLSGEAHRLESIYEQKLNSLTELKQSLLHQAFTGAL